MIQAKDLTYSYRFEGSKYKTLDGFTLSVRSGEFVVILGHNGSGKTTFARHCNALLPMQGGSLTVSGMDVGNKSCLWDIRRTCGMVFQNPDNQFVSSVVEEDLAFGLRNFGVPEAEIPLRIEKALETVGMSGFEKRSPHLLSGGQKQRIAIAGVLAVEPEILVLDEVTAMLDPQGRREVLSTVQRLHEEGKTIVMISHYIEEAVLADRVVMVHDGRVVDEGPPAEILTDMDVLRRVGMLPPVTVQAYYDLKAAGVKLDLCPLTMEALVEELCRSH
ncbi:MAG: energy-coupling factor transporter ATPase [Oscillospiraceae bacterium]|nr:energy-coupling factor transporter ATPase [Oscillospiraceae bacterium]